MEAPETARSSVDQQDLHMASLLGANTKFYEAYSHLDLKAMADIWEPSQRATCVHSGWPLITGYANVLESWSCNFQDICVEYIVVTDAHAVIHHGVGWIYCREHFDLLYWAGNLSSFEARATNIFVESDGGWRMVYHHSAASVIERSPRQ